MFRLHCGQKRARPVAQSGEAWFKSQAARRKLMGARSFEYFKRGEVQLSDFVGRRKDAHLGTVIYRRSLKDVFGRKRRAD
jgi:hypothetical protein